jgi:tetratricopeptide (TPR) repeat protein
VNIPSRSSRQWLPAALIFAFIFLAYLPSLKRESIWDDDSTLFQNPLVKASDGLYHVWCSTRPHDYWPLTFTSFWLEWRLWGANPLGYRITNILLHALGVVLLWKILCRLKLPGAWWAALIYGLHPVCVASVAWISERKNTLSLPFFLLSIWWYLRAEEERNVSCVMCQVSSIGALPVTQHATPNTQHATRFYLLSLLAFLLALLSKTSVVMLPVVLLLVVWWRRGQRSDIRDQKSEVRSPKSKAQCPKSPTFAEGSAGFHASRITHHALRLLPFFALSLALGVVTVWFQQHRAFGSAPPSAPMLDRLAASAWSPWFYVSKALAPLNLSVLYGKWPVPAFWFSSLLALGWCALLALLWYYRKRLGRGWFFGFAYFTISLLPVLGFFDLYYFNYSWVADHWQYLALIGIVVPLTCGFWFWAGKWKTRGLLPQFVVGAAALVLGVSSCWRAVLYGSSELLWQDALKKNPRSWVACNNLANALDDRGRADEALNLYQAALQLNPDYVEALNNLATLEVRLGKETDALAHYSEALRLNPAFAEAHNNLASLLLGQGKLPEARAHFVEALRLQPDYADAAYNLGNLLEKEGKPADAFRQYVLALRLNPKFAQAYYNAGNLRAAQGDYLDAARFFSKAVDIAPAFAEAQFNLGLALQRLGRAQEADLHLRIALRLNPALAPRPSGQLPLEKTAPK